MTQRLDFVTRMAKRLGNEVDTGAATEKDKEIPARLIRHGSHQIIALDRKDFVVLVFAMDIPEEDSKALAALHEDVQRRLFAVLRREMLEGRSGFSIRVSDDDPPRLQQIRIEQKLVVEEADGPTTQRLADGLQELVVVGQRCIEVLGQAFSDIREAQSTSTSPHDYMYV